MTTLAIKRAIELREEAKRLEERGELARAELLCRQALEVFEREEGHGSPDVARLTHSLGCTESGRHSPAPVGVVPRGADSSRAGNRNS